MPDLGKDEHHDDDHHHLVVVVMVVVVVVVVECGVVVVVVAGVVAVVVVVACCCVCVCVLFLTRLDEHAMCMSTPRDDAMQPSLKTNYVVQVARHLGVRQTPSSR